MSRWKLDTSLLPIKSHWALFSLGTTAYLVYGVYSIETHTTDPLTEFLAAIVGSGLLLATTLSIAIMVDKKQRYRSVLLCGLMISALTILATWVVIETYHSSQEAARDVRFECGKGGKFQVISCAGVSLTSCSLYCGLPILDQSPKKIPCGMLDVITDPHRECYSLGVDQRAGGAIGEWDSYEIIHETSGESLTDSCTKYSVGAMIPLANDSLVYLPKCANQSRDVVSHVCVYACTRESTMTLEVGLVVMFYIANSLIQFVLLIVTNALTFNFLGPDNKNKYGGQIGVTALVQIFTLLVIMFCYLFSDYPEDSLLPERGYQAFLLPHLSLPTIRAIFILFLLCHAFDIACVYVYLFKNENSTGAPQAWSVFNMMRDPHILFMVHAAAVTGFLFGAFNVFAMWKESETKGLDGKGEVAQFVVLYALGFYIMESVLRHFHSVSDYYKIYSGLCVAYAIRFMLMAIFDAKYAWFTRLLSRFEGLAFSAGWVTIAVHASHLTSPKMQATSQAMAMGAYAFIGHAFGDYLRYLVYDEAVTVTGSVVMAFMSLLMLALINLHRWYIYVHRQMGYTNEAMTGPL